MNNARNTPDTIECGYCEKTAYYWYISGMSNYKQLDERYHSMTVQQIYHCSSQHITMREETMIESHGWSEYEDQGHGVNCHKYKIKCKCGYYQEIQILCEFSETGGHSTPW